MILRTVCVRPQAKTPRRVELLEPRAILDAAMANSLFVPTS